MCFWIALMMGAVRTSETSLYFNDTTRRYIPQGCHLHTRRHENLKYHKKCFPFLQTNTKVEDI
jgi:hypothetical protein